MNARFHSLFVNALTFSRVPLIFAFMAPIISAQQLNFHWYYRNPLHNFARIAPGYCPF